MTWDELIAWRDRLLEACLCGAAPACPVHAPHGWTEDGSVILDAETEWDYIRERNT